MHPAVLSLAQELVRQVNQRLRHFDESMGSQAARANWLAGQANALEVEACRFALRSMLRSEFAALCMGIGNALDGATAMSDCGQPVFLADRSGELIREGVSTGLVEYFDENLF